MDLLLRNETLDLIIEDVTFGDNLHPFLKSHYHVIAVGSLYLSFVKLFGPKLMSSRKPFQLKELLMAYNFVQICFNIYLLYIYFNLLGMNGIAFWRDVCNPVTSANYSNTANFDDLLTKGLTLYYVNKIMDLLDTVFILLRKKNSQITFLHLFHHTIMVFSTWMSTHILPKEEIVAVFAGVNSFVHVAMYTYYFLSNFGPNVRKYLWWKKYLTTMQIVQFFIGLYCLAGKLIDGCSVNPSFMYLWLFNYTVFLILFINFYVNSYRKVKTT